MLKRTSERLIRNLENTTGHKHGNNTSRSEAQLQHATDGGDEGTDGKRLLDGRQSVS